MYVIILINYYLLFYSITNQFNIENDNPVGNGIREISPVLEVNEPEM